MTQFFIAALAALGVFFRTRGDTALEILALRQQVAVLKRQLPRPRLNAGDRLFCFRLYWHWRSRSHGGKPRISQEARDLIGRLAKENPAWGAPEIHAEIQKLGFTIAARTVARYLRRMVRLADPAQKWLAFLANHREVIVAFDFFTVPTVTFRMLYCFCVIEHERRKILHCNVSLANS